MTKIERRTITEVREATLTHLVAVNRLLKMKKLWKPNAKARSILLDVAIGLDISEDKLSIMLEGY